MAKRFHCAMDVSDQNGGTVNETTNTRKGASVEVTGEENL